MKTSNTASSPEKKRAKSAPRQRRAVVDEPVDLPAKMEEVDQSKWNTSRVWTAKLGTPFTPVSSYFLANYHRLDEPISPAELTLIVHLLAFKWTEKMPFPAFSSLAKRIGRSPGAVREAARNLEKNGYLKRHMRIGERNLFDLTPLFDKVEELYDLDKKEGRIVPTKPRRK